jgi:hypothetical protein
MTSMIGNVIERDAATNEADLLSALNNIGVS